jgi:hypothetical protein
MMLFDPQAQLLQSQQSQQGQMQYQYSCLPPSLSDYDIELMAICIANTHPQVEGKASCFCMLKRLERGISKD